MVPPVAAEPREIATVRRRMLLVDDNITLDATRFRKLAEAIVEHGLNSREYLVQASVAGIVSDPELIPSLARANFSMVFLGIEAVQMKNLQLFQKGDIPEKTEEAVSRLRRHDIGVMGGFIIGNPDDNREDIREVFSAARRLRIDLPYVQCVTPYPGTRIREELLEAGLVTNPDDLSRYTGFICNVRTRNLTNRQLNRLMNWENIKIFFSPSMFGICVVAPVAIINLIAVNSSLPFTIIVFSSINSAKPFTTLTCSSVLRMSTYFFCCISATNSFFC